MNGPETSGASVPASTESQGKARTRTLVNPCAFASMRARRAFAGVNRALSTSSYDVWPSIQKWVPSSCTNVCGCSWSRRRKPWAAAAGAPTTIEPRVRSAGSAADGFVVYVQVPRAVGVNRTTQVWPAAAPVVVRKPWVRTGGTREPRGGVNTASIPWSR